MSNVKTRNTYTLTKGGIMGSFYFFLIIVMFLLLYTVLLQLGNKFFKK